MAIRVGLGKRQGFQMVSKRLCIKDIPFRIDFCGIKTPNNSTKCVECEWRDPRFTKIDKVSSLLIDAKIRKGKGLTAKEYKKAAELGDPDKDLFIITTTIEKVKGDPVSFLMGRAT